MTVAYRAAAAAVVLALAACVARPPNEAGPVGVIVPAPSGSGGGVQSGGPIAPTLPIEQPTPLPNTRPPLSPDLPRSIEDSRAAAAVISLVKSARAALDEGRTDKAGASLERAMRIEPRNPWVWQALAGLHLVTQQAEQAEAEAKKSTSLSRRNPYIEVENWRLIAEARKLRGDAVGAAEASDRREELLRLVGP